MLNKVYLMCSLPALSFGQPPPITLKKFREMAKYELSSRSFNILEQMSMQGSDSNDRKAKMKKVDNMLEGLLKDISEIRNSRNEKRQARPALLPGSLLEANPLDREIQIMQWQWEYLDSLVFGKNFSLAEVVVYKLKLQLLFRMQSFNEERGERVMDSVVNPAEKKE